MMRSKKFSLIVFALIMFLCVQMMPLAFADAPKYEKVLKIVSGSQSNLGTLTYGGHTVSEGFAVSISMMAAVEPNEWSFSRGALAVSLGSSWSEGKYSYKPRVSKMWMKIEGDSNFRIDTGGIADNTGTGGECTDSWEIVLDVLMAILPLILEYLAETPPRKEWQGGPPDALHWAKAIVRSKVAYEGGRIQPTYNPSVETAGCDFNSLFLQKGYQYLTITAGADICLVYSYWSQGDYLSWSTIPIGTYSVTFEVEVPVTNEPETPSKPWGTTSGYVGSSYTFYSDAIDPEDDNIRYKFDWGDGSTPTTTGWYTSGSTASASHTWGSSGTYYVRVRAQDVYEEWSNLSPILAVAITTSGGGGGGECPYVSVWDGNNYVLDNDLFPTSPLGNGADVEDYYKLEQTLVPQNGKYQLLISEFEQEHSYIDQVKLLAVDHESDVNIAMAPDGEILTYKTPTPPTSAVDRNGTDRLNQIRYMDGDLSDPATFFQGNVNDYLQLNFGPITSENAKLIVRNDMLCCVKCINVQVRDIDGEWQSVAVIASRAYWAIEGVNLSPYILEGQDLMVRLVWTQPHKLDYVGLDTTKQDDYELHTANLLSATHSTQGDVKTLVSQNDNTYAELIPGQQIQLAFTLPRETKQTRTFILYAEGRYDPMP